MFFRGRGRYLGLGGNRGLTGLICMAKSNSCGEVIKCGGYDPLCLHISASGLIRLSCL